MVVYNITTKITPEIEEEWLLWQQQEHTPEIMATNLFTGYRIFRLLETDEADGPTFTIQYFSPSLENYNLYIHHFAPGLRRKAFEKWGDRFIAYRTIMEVVN